MVNCDLAEIKKAYGDRIVLKGNLHTIQEMLLGSVDDVIRASRAAIDAAKAGGRFILSTGDQCGRDTPVENIQAMIETARTHGIEPGLFVDQPSAGGIDDEGTSFHRCECRSPEDVIRERCQRRVEGKDVRLRQELGHA